VSMASAKSWSLLNTLDFWK